MTQAATNLIAKMMLEHEIVAFANENGTFTAGILDYNEHEGTYLHFPPATKDDKTANSMNEAVLLVIEVITQREREYAEDELRKHRELLEVATITEEEVLAISGVILDDPSLKLQMTFHVDKNGIVVCANVAIGLIQNHVFQRLTSVAKIVSISKQASKDGIVYQVKST